MESMLKGLNVAQKAAVTSQATIIQVLAPPGSGKTKTLTSRVAYLLAHHGYAPRNVICCTFTLKASREMRERLRGLVGTDLESKLVLGTFHSICRRYLVTYGYLIGLPKNFGIADSDDSLGILKRIQKRLKLSIDPKTARSRISHRKARGKRLEDNTSAAKTIAAQEFATIFREYENALQISNLLDYDDLLLRCVELLRQHPECVANIEALLIDEFQDTNIVQFELMKLLASSKKRITIVGDPDQSIYGFRSAEIENLRKMKEYFPDTVVINLEENYRSSSAILCLAQKVIEQDKERPQKKLQATHCYGTLPVLRRLPNPHEEALWIVNEIKRIHNMTGQLTQYSDIAILLRSAFLSLLIEKALANAGIPYRMVGGRRFFDRVEVRILLDYLRVISHPDNNSAFLSIINTPSRKIGDTTVSELTKVAEAQKKSLWEAVQQILSGKLNMEKKLSNAAETGLRELVSLVKHARTKMNSFEPAKTPGQLIELVIQKLQFESFIKKQYREDFEERWENVQELATQARDVTFDTTTNEDQLAEIEGVRQDQVQSGQEVLARFLANVALSTEVEADETDIKPRVTISTIHSAKGLEWPVVFVPAVYEGSIPHSRSEDTDEERRLLYVAMTRAQALLYMTFPVMQSRDQSQSILTQFLPGDSQPLLTEAGCKFTDKVVNDVATILRRPPPSQEALVEGLITQQEKGHEHDDIWPTDGSYRRGYTDVGIESSTFWQTSGGQSLADALQGQTSVQQKRDCSSLATFTTAGYQMSIMPAQDDTLVKKNDGQLKLSKQGPDQGNLHSFFTSGSLKPTSIAVQEPPAQSLFQPYDNSHKFAATIPPELSAHTFRTNSGSSRFTGIKRPRPILEETSPNRSAANKRHYIFLSSSPPPEDPLEGSVSNLKEENYSSIVKTASTTVAITNMCNSYEPSSTYTTTMAHFEQKHDQGVGSVMHASSKASTSFHASYSSGRLNSLAKPAPLLSTSLGGSNLQQTRRTLGVRRTMTSWADRKNK